MRCCAIGRTDTRLEQYPCPAASGGHVEVDVAAADGEPTGGRQQPELQALRFSAAGRVTGQAEQ